MDTITAQWQIRLPHRPLDGPEVCSKRWSYDDAEEYVYGKLAEVVYNGAMKGGVALVEIAAAVRCGDMLITMSKATPAAGGRDGLDLDAVYRRQKAVKKYA
jgi:hypothetical protein